MFKISKKKLNLLIAMVFFLFLLIPTVNGTGGTTIGNAPTFEPGYYPDEVRFGYAHYNISGQIGSNLTVIVTYTVPDSSALRLYAPNGTELADSNTLSGVEVVSAICDSDLLYTIRLANPFPNGVGSHSYSLTICLDDNCGGGIPGFDLLVAFLGIITLVGIVIFYKEHQNFSI
jgi:hypothetical protein